MLRHGRALPNYGSIQEVCRQSIPRLCHNKAVLQALLLLAAIPAGPNSPLSFSVSYPASRAEAVSAVIYLSKAVAQPMHGPDWFNPEPCYSANFDAKAGSSLLVNDRNAVGFPAKLAQLAPGDYTVQAVIDRNLGGRAIAESTGNYFSDPVHLHLDPDSSGNVSIECTHLVVEPVHHDSDRIKYVRLRSKLLSDHYRRDTYLKAAVALPRDYSGSARAFPTIYEVPGFGGSVDDSGEVGYSLSDTDQAGQSFVHVLLDPNCPTGHCVFADSQNNGPWGTALITELIPYLEQHFRIEPAPKARFLRGHSSGGWSSLWLQVSHPTFFGGVWSTSPDPVDFTDFQRIDIYRPSENMFTDPAGKARPLARDGAHILAYFKAFSDMERPIRGEQLGSFEAVFSPRGPDGQPQKLWDRDSGAINLKVAEAWKKYDIDLILKSHWSDLAPKLSGKIHVYCGNEDTFYLDGAVRKLKDSLHALGSDAKVELFQGNHFTVLTSKLRDRIAHEMSAQYTQAESHS